MESKLLKVAFGHKISFLSYLIFVNQSKKELQKKSPILDGQCKHLTIKIFYVDFYQILQCCRKLSLFPSIKCDWVFLFKAKKNLVQKAKPTSEKDPTEKILTACEQITGKYGSEFIVFALTFVESALKKEGFFLS